MIYDDVDWRKKIWRCKFTPIAYQNWIDGGTFTNPRLGLRPLSDLTKEIVVECLKKPIVFASMYGEVLCSADADYQSRIEERAMHIEMGIKTKNINLATFEKLILCHFDVFGWIEKGWAIDVNTFKD